MHQLEQISLHSAVLRAELPVTLLLPPDAGPQQPYPVLYLLHSLAGGSSIPARCKVLSSRIADLPLILVMPECGRNFYINTADGRRYEDYLVQELLPYIDAHFPTLASRERRAVGGPSMGGFGALMLALRHRDCFGAAFSQSGAINAPQWVQDGPAGSVFGPPDSPLRSTYDLYRLAALPGPLPALYFDCGLDDFLIQENRDFHSYLKARQIPHRYREHVGEHGGSYWNDYTSEAIAFVLQHVRQ